MDISRVQKLVAKLKTDIEELETEVSKSVFLQSKRFDDFSKWFVATEDNTIESMRSCLSRFNSIEKKLNLNLTTLKIPALERLEDKINSKNFDVAERTLDNYKSAIKTLIRYKVFKGEK